MKKLVVAVLALAAAGLLAELLVDGGGEHGENPVCQMARSLMEITALISEVMMKPTKTITTDV